MRATSKIFAPHGAIQRYIMHFLAGEGPPYTAWIACGSKFGKTVGAAGSMANAVPKNPNSTNRIIAPIYRQTKISWKYIDKLWPKHPWVERRKGDMSMYLPGVRSELQFWHGQNPEDLEGEGIKKQVNDECAKLKEQVNISSKTTHARTKARVLNISTPRGRNWFYRGCMKAKREMERAKHEGRLPLEVFLTAPTLANPTNDPEYIAQQRMLLPDRLARQYFDAAFVDDGAVFPLPVYDTNVWKEKYQKTGPVDYWIHPEADQKTIVAGADWAKKQDYTVVTAWDYSIVPFRMVGFLRMHKKPYTDQVVDVAKFLRRFKECDFLYHDKTGVGEAIDDLLAAVPGLHYEGLTFSNATKASIINDMITLCERREVLFPWWEELRHEMEVFEVHVSDIGNMIYGASEGNHDDIVNSCALGLAACQRYAGDMEVRFLDELPQAEYQKDTIDNYIHEMLDIDPEEGF